jgi:hypothetical protein
LYTCVHISIIHKSPIVEATQMAINEWPGKQNRAYVHNGILASLQSKENSDMLRQESIISWEVK